MPRKPTNTKLPQKAQEAIFAELRQHIEPVSPGLCRYRNGETDKTIAARLGVPFESVRYRREQHEEYGKLAKPEPQPQLPGIGEHERLFALIDSHGQRVIEMLQREKELGAVVDRLMSLTETLTDQVDAQALHIRELVAAVDKWKDKAGLLEGRIDTIVMAARDRATRVDQFYEATARRVSALEESVGTLTTMVPIDGGLPVHRIADLERMVTDIKAGLDRLESEDGNRNRLMLVGGTPS